MRQRATRTRIRLPSPRAPCTTAGLPCDAEQRTAGAMAAQLNASPVVHLVAEERPVSAEALDDDVAEPIDAREVFDLVRAIHDPEHPLTLEQLHVTQLPHIHVDNACSYVRVEFTPTIPHCSMATLIGLCLHVRLLRCLPPRFKARALRPGRLVPRGWPASPTGMLPVLPHSSAAVNGGGRWTWPFGPARTRPRRP